MQIDLVSILLELMVTFVQLKVSGRLLHRSLQYILEVVLLVYPLVLGFELWGYPFADLGSVQVSPLLLVPLCSAGWQLESEHLCWCQL